MLQKLDDIMQENVDILILHGMSKGIVEYLEKFFKSLGLRAETVLNLPSLKKEQEQKVNHYIKNCRLPLVLVTFDEGEENPTKARPNVYDEIARCRQHKRKDTLVLQEKKSGKLVQLPSNIEGRLVVIQFESKKLERLVISLLTEIR